MPVHDDRSNFEPESDEETLRQIEATTRVAELIAPARKALAALKRSAFLQRNGIEE